MRSDSSVGSRILRRSMKAATLLTLLTLVFSPVGQVFETPTVQAVDFSEADLVPESEQLQLNLTDDQIHALAQQRCASRGGIIDGYLCRVSTSLQIRENVTDSSDPPGLCNSIPSCILLPVYVFTVGLGSLVANVSAYFFNIATQMSLSSTAYGMSFISQGWSAARDIANMFFILILIYIAITIMLQAETGGTMQSLVWVIFIALIINFSFFLTRVAIDASNIVALQFYNAIPAAADSQGSTLTAAGGKDLTAGIMNALGVQRLLGTQSFQNFTAETDMFTQFITLVVLYVFAGGMYFILAAAFFAAGLKFLIRIAVLWLTIIASPLALIAKASQRFEKQFDQWQETLITHAFYPAVFLFIFWIISLFADGLKIDSAFKDFLQNPGGAEAGITASISLIADISIRLGFVAIMLFLGIKAADSIGVMGAQAAKSFGNKFSFGTGGWVGRQTLGRAGLAASRSEAVRSWASRSAAGGAVLRSAKFLSGSSFDMRGLPGAGNLKEYVGEARKGGIAKEAEERDKRKQQAIESFGKNLKGDIRDEQKAQKAFKADFDRKNGAGSYDNRVKEISEAVKNREKEVGELKNKAKKAATREDRKEFTNQAKEAEKDLKIIKENLTDLTQAGKKAVEKAGKTRTELWAKRLSGRWEKLGLTPSRGTLKGIAGLTHHESTKDKLAAAAKALAEEEGGGDHAPAQHAPPKQEEKKPAPAANESANDNHHPPANDNHDGGGGHH